MMAIGASPDDAESLCREPRFAGRLQVAAVNSNSSITLSGDEDAIDEAEAALKAEGTFARKLKVDTAYHSAHMLSCADAYLVSLASCDINYLQPAKDSATTWFSSVYKGSIMTAETLTNQYWMENMCHTVEFAGALSAALEHNGAFDIALEVGPHAALQGPALSTLNTFQGGDISTPYTSLLSRGQNDIDQLSSALGYIWTRLGSESVRFSAVQDMLCGDKTKSVVQDLPPYPFDHHRSYWISSRIPNHFKHRDPNHVTNPVLGNPCSEATTPGEFQWRKILQPTEMSWLKGHMLQGQTVFPATGYVSMAVEAAITVSRQSNPNSTISLIKLREVTIPRAIAFDDDSSTVEIIFSVTSIHIADQKLTAEWACYSVPEGAAQAVLNAKGGVCCRLSQAEPSTLPAVKTDAYNLVDVDEEELYSNLSSIGYDYASPFRGLSNIHRKLDYSIGDLIDQSGTGWDDNLTLHPGMLDSALQTVFAAWSYPGDTSICSLHVPVSISSITINPYFTALRDGGKQEKLRYETYIRSKTPSAVVGDIYLAPENDDYTFIQFEGATLVPFARAVAKYDLPMFSKFQNGVAFPDGQMAANGETMSDFEIQMYKDVDRAAYWFTRNASLSIPPKDRLNILPHFQRYLSWCDRMVDMVSQDAHPKVKPECNADSRETITQLLSAYEGRKDIRFVEVVGDNLVDVIRAGTSMLEHMNQDGLLRAFYEENAICSGPTGRWLARVISQIAHRNPSLDIFEVGAGTGATTSAVLNEIGDTYASYTFTDISSGFFIDAEERFTNQAGRMVFKTFNMEKEPSGQGFTEGVYDVALAVNVLHVSADLEASLSNVRRLLKSGGFLVVAELTSTDLLFSGMTVGTLPGWWIGAETGRPWGPLLSLRQWDSTLKQAGFSGIDTLTPDISSSLPMSVFVTQAVNDQINLLRNPLAVHERPVNVRNEALAVVGGMTLPVHKLGQKVSEVLSHRFQDKQHFETMEDFVTSRMATSQTPVTVLSLVDLDRPYLEDLTAAKFDALKVLWAVAGTVLWVTCGSKADRPYSQMMKGIVRTVQTEYPNLRVQMYDLDPKVNGGTGIDQSTAAELAVDLLREHILNEWGTDNNLLWTSEPEVSVSEGKKLVTRLIPDLQRNQRYNSRRRDVIATTDTVYDTVQLVAVEQGNKDWSMEVQKESPLEAWSCPTTSHRNVRIEFSTLQSLPVGGSARFRLCLGSDQDTGETIIALTGSSSSLAKVPKTRCLPIDQIPTPTLLLSIGHSLVAEHLLSLVPQGGTLLVNEPGLDLQTALRAKAGVKRVRTVFISAAAQHDEDASLILDPNLPQHVIKNIIPGSVSVFVHYSHNTASDAVRDAVLKYLPSGCLKIDGGDVLGFETNASLTHEADITVASVLKIALDDRLQVDGSTKSVDCVDLEEVTRHKRCGGPLRVVDWAATRFVNAKVQPIDKGTLFQADRTYLFVGMAGELGQSIAEWMIKHGAGNIVLTSRTPKVNGKFIEDMRKRYRAVVKALPLDITSRQSLDHALDEIRSQMPSIGGIINGAMVLEDELFSNMTLESFRRVTAPKVLGTQLLDQAFYNDTSLDFFIVTSSIASIIGWTGQSNYSAANEWMTSLAYSRRARGVAASVVNIPAVLGVGYAAHAEFFDFNYFQSLGHINISEEDLHTLFAEAVLSGRPGQDSNVEAQVCMGVNFISPDLEVKVSHKRDVKFSHFIKREEKSVDFKAAKASVRGKVQIESAETPEEIYGIARDAFWAHLKRLLRVPAEEELDDTTGLVDRGVDSLVAVDIRAWFLKELGVDVPTLKILGGGSVAELIKTALERMAEAAAAVVVASTDSSGVSSQSRSPTFTPAAPSSEAASSVESESGENPELIDG
jgi:hybrid polyketide synthase/nonribosomal peptide synthetase ACE1